MKKSDRQRIFDKYNILKGKKIKIDEENKIEIWRRIKLSSIGILFGVIIQSIIIYNWNE